MISAKKLLLSGGVAKPFTRSGSFETGIEGWILGGSLQRVQNGRAVRTGTWSLVQPTSPGQDGVADYILRSREFSGLRVTAQIYHRTNNGTSARQILYRFGNEPFVVGAEVRDSSFTFGLLSAVIPQKFGADLTIRLLQPSPGNGGGSGGAVFDDWQIVGERP